MTASVYENMKLVQLEPDGEWYVAIPRPQSPDADLEETAQVLAVDVDKNLTFASTFTQADVAGVKDVAPLNRFITVRLEFVPGMLEASIFHLLANALHQPVSDIAWWQSSPQQKFNSLVSGSVSDAFGQGLHQALMDEPERDETLYVDHDYIAHGLQSMWMQSGMEEEGDDEDGDVYPAV